MLSGIHEFTSERNSAETVGLFLLDAIGRNFELLAFCLATEIWLRTAVDARPRSVHSGMRSPEFWFRRWTCVFVSSTVLLVLVSVCSSIAEFPPSKKVESATPIREFQTIVEAACWGIHMLTVPFVIGMTSKCVLTLVPSEEWKKRLFLLSKTVGPMVVSFLAYGTRFGWLIAASIDQNLRNSWDWWIGFVWVPSATVSVVLLYSMRKPDDDIETVAATEGDDDNSNVNGNSDLEESLLRPQPPEGKMKLSQSNEFKTIELSLKLFSCFNCDHRSLSSISQFP